MIRLRTPTELFLYSLMYATKYLAFHTHLTTSSMSLQPHLSADTFLHLPSKCPTIPTRINNNKNTIIFFIPGNPGLLGYYHEFLSLLATSSSQTSQCTIAGFSL